MFDGTKDELSRFFKWVQAVLHDGDELKGHRAFRGYRAGSSMSKSRLLLSGFFALGIVGDVVSAVLSNDDSISEVAGAAIQTFNPLFLLAVFSSLVSLACGSLLILQWRKHGRVVRALANLNYECTNLLNKNFGVTAREALTLFCEKAAIVFASEMPCAGIGCAVRYRTDNGFETFARKGCLNPRREESTEPLGTSSEIYQMLDDNRYYSYHAFVCNDTASARDEERLDRDDNGVDPEFGKDDSSLIVSRLVSFDRNEEKIIGIFYITSNKTNSFHTDSIDLYLFLHDYVNFMILNILDREKSMSEAGSQLTGGNEDGR